MCYYLSSYESQHVALTHKCLFHLIISVLFNNGMKESLDNNSVPITDSDIKSTSGISVNLVNNHGISNTRKYNLIVEYIEAQDGQFIFRVNNRNTTGPRWTYVQYAFTINY